MSFEWQTEDERGWERPEPSGDNGSRRRPRWPWLLLLAVVITSGAYFAWKQVADRVEEGTETVREEVRSSFALAVRAAGNGDEELFVSLLSGRSATWTDTQRERVDKGLLFAQAGRVFAFQAGGDATGQAAVELNPELTEAYLSVAQPFVVDAGSGLTETVVLTQTHVFRRGSQLWLLSPPDETYWGGWQTREGRALQVTYPERDADVALRLQEDLERKLMEMCRTLVQCPQDFRMRLRLETDVQSIVSAASREERLVGGSEISLPTPSLVGLPRDEAAYAALFRGYGTHLISTALVHLLDYTCCELALFQEALLDWQLSRLDLRSAPLSDQNYLQLLIDKPLHIDHLARMQRPYEPLAADEEAPLEVHAFVDFLRDQLAMRRDPLGDMQRSLSESRSFWGWVRSLTEYEPTVPGPLQEQWVAFVWEKVREAQELAQPLPQDSRPQQDIVAMCGDDTLDIFRYSFLTEQWTQEVETGVTFAALAPLPSGEGYMMTGQLANLDFEEGFVTYMRRGSEEPFTLVQQEPPNSALLPWGLSDPGGERMIAWHYSLQSDGDGIPGTVLIDPETCSEQGCTLQPVPGQPVWSPDGRLALAVDFTDGSILYLPQGATSWRSLELDPTFFPFFPFWLSDESFGVIAESGSGGPPEQRLVVVETTSGEVVELVTSGELAEVLDGAPRGNMTGITFATKNPQDDDSILLGFRRSVGSANQSYVFSLEYDPGQAPTAETSSRLRLLETIPGGLETGWFNSNLVMGDRYVMFPVSEENHGIYLLKLVLYDLQEERVVFSTSADQSSGGFFLSPVQWTGDGQWFAYTLSGAINIVSPSLPQSGSVYRELIFHDFERCESVIWVNR